MRTSLLLILFAYLQTQALIGFAASTNELHAPPLAQLTSNSQQSVNNYRLVLSELKRQQAQTFGELEQRIAGTLWRRTWQIKDMHLDKLNDFFLQQLDEAEIRYQCKNLDCGASQFWANEVFSNPALLGRDNQQRYFVAQINDNPTQTYIFYAAKRHTGAYFLQLDIISSKQTVAHTPTIKEINLQLQQSHGWLSGLYTQSDGSLNINASQPLINALKQLPKQAKQRLYLILHTYDSPQMQANITHSQQLASALKKQTKTAQSTLNIQGLGALTQPPNQTSKVQLRFVFWPKIRNAND